MLDRAIVVDVLNSGIGNPTLILKKRREPSRRNVATFVDRGRQHSAAMLTVPNGVIRASPKKGDAKWGSSNDHASVLLSYKEMKVSRLFQAAKRVLSNYGLGPGPFESMSSWNLHFLIFVAFRTIPHGMDPATFLLSTVLRGIAANCFKRCSRTSMAGKGWSPA